MNMRRWIVVLAVLCGWLPQASLARVYLRWTEGKLPAAEVLGVKEIVIPWNESASGLLAAAKTQGFPQATSAQAPFWRTGATGR